MARVADLMSPCTTLRPEESLAQAARAFWEGACDGLPVVDDDGRLVGLVTDRDLAMCAAIEGANPHDLRVAQAMTASEEGLAPTASLGDAHAWLRERQAERAPVLDGERQVLGLLRFGDLVRDSASRPTARKAAADVRTTLAILSGVDAEQAEGSRRRKAAPREARPTATHALKTTGGRARASTAGQARTARKASGAQAGGTTRKPSGAQAGGKAKKVKKAKKAKKASGAQAGGTARKASARKTTTRKAAGTTKAGRRTTARKGSGKARGAGA